MSDYNYVLTNAGQQLIAQRFAANQAVVLDSLEVGTGQYTPAATATALQSPFSPVRRFPNLKGTQEGNSLLFQFEDLGSDAYNVGEVGVFSGTTLVFLASRPSSEGYLVVKPAGQQVLYPTYINVSRANTGTFTFSGTPTIADRYPGELMSFAGATPPAGWLVCDGRAVSRTTYGQLFAAIGTTWGAGDGSTTFNLPDGRGKALLGAGQGTGLTARALGSTGGEESALIVVRELPAHGHDIHVEGPGPETGAYFRNSALVNNAAGLIRRRPGNAFLNNSYITDVNGSPITDQQRHSNMQPWMAVNWLIKT